MDQENGKRLFKTPQELGVDILDEQGKVVHHVDYGTNGITGLNLQDVYEYTSPEGEKTYYSKETDIPSGVYLDADTGRIKIQVPEKWKDDEKVKSWADSTTLKLISGNYRNNKDVKYPHPYDETKQITTQEYVDYLNSGLKVRIAALEAEIPTKMNLIQYFGGDDKKNAAIDNLSAEDVVTMSLSYDKDDSWVPLPEYMLVAYPQLKKLSTYKNGFVQKKDFLDNFYNIESGAITERYAYGIATAPQKVLENIEDLDANEIAKTVGFSRFISQVDPKRSPISQFLQAGDALARGFYGSLTDWTKDTAELIGNIATFSWATGEKADVSEFMGGLLFGENGFLTPSSTEALAPAIQQMAATNKDALTKAQAGLAQGAIAGKALDMVISTAAINKVANIASNAITNAITSAGGRALGNAMTATRAAEYTTEGLATVSNATGMASTAGTVAANQTILAKTAASGGAAYTAFFEQTLGSALYTYSKNIGGMTTYFRAMPTAQFATIVNSAAKIANAATYANTAVGVLGSMVFAAIVNNKELTNKVLSGEATSDEAKDLLRQTLFDTAKVQAASWMLGLNPKIAGLENKFSDKLESINQAMSQFFTGLGAKAASPWIRFMQWLVNNKAAAAAAGGAKLSNAAVARAEAVKEAVLLNEAKQYSTNLSRVAGTNAPRLLEEALASAGIDIGTSMAETLKKLEEVGYNFDPSDLAMSEFEGWQGSMAELRNVLTTWGDINTNVSKVVLEFTNPDIQPTISQQMSEINKADTELINAEKEAGLLDDKTYKTDIKLSKQDEGYIYSAHSEELSRYIVRKYEMGVVANEARANNITDLDNYQPYVEARARYAAAAELVPENIRNIADTKYLPALKKAEHEIINVMMNDGVYPRSFVEAMRAGGKFGTDGNDWIRLVARKDLPKGTYNPYSKTVKRDNTIALGSFNILEDGDITWPGNGLQELITEYGVARSEKAFLDASKRATGLVTDVKIPGRKTAAAGRIEEFKTDFEKAVKQGFKSFTEDVEGTAAVGNKRANQQREFYNEVATLGGVQTADIEDLRAVMRENDLPMAENIVDRQTLDKFLTESSDEAKKIMTNAVGEKASDRIVSDYTEKASFRTLEKREKIAKLDSDIAQFKKDVDLYKNSLNWAAKELPDGFSDVQRANAEKFIQSHVEAGKKALERLGYKASPNKFDEWSSRKLKKLEEKRSGLVDKVLSERGKSRPAIKFEGNLYPGVSEQIQYIPNRKKRQKISDDALGVWNGDQGGLANEWLNNGDYEVKPQLREAIEQNPELRNALLSTMYDNSGSKLPFDEWLNTPITLKRQQNVDSLREEDAFLSFSMNKNWAGIGGLVPRLDNVPGDIVTLEIKPINTLGEIPKGIEAEDELEVIVPREAYATAMSNYDRAMKSNEMKRYEQSIKNMEDEIAELSPVENAQEFIPTLNYQQRKELAQKFADANPEYTVLYRMQGGAPDQWRPNNRGKAGKFEGNAGEMKGAVWLTSYPDWVEGPERATAGVKSEFTDGTEVTDDNIVVIPVKKSDIFDNTYSGGEEYKNDEVLRKKIEDSGKKLIQTRTAEKIEAVNSLQEKGIPPRLMDHTNPKNNERTEFILFEQDHPEVLSDGMNLMLEQYNKQFDNPVYRRRIANIQRDIDYSRDNEAISMVLDEALATEQFVKLEALKTKSSDRYEKLLEKADRANAANNEKVKNSNVVQDAAAEYRKNVKSLEDSTILTEKFSYLAQLPTAKGSLKDFAESNNLQLPEGDGDLNGKVKEALWNMLQEGKDLPSIKGLKKTDYKLDSSKKESYKNIDVDSLLKNPDNGLIVDKKEFFKLLGKTELFRNPAGPNSLKYELNKEDLYNDIDDAIDGMMDLIKKNGRANSAIESMVEYTNGNPSETRFEFAVLCEVLSKNGLSTYKQSIKDLAHKVVDGAIGDRKAIVKGNLRSLYEQVETAIYDKLKSRLAAAKNALESAGETVESETITDLLTQYAKEIGDAEADPFIVKTTNKDGEIQYERVSPAIAGIYNERGVYEPLGTGTRILSNLALLKKINTTDLSPRSFMKQSFSDPAMAFATVGAIPGSLQALRDEIEAQLGPDVFQALQKVDPARYKNIELIAEREGISLEEALARNLKAIANTEVPFTLLNEEILRQAKVSKYGLKAANKMNAKNRQDKINSALRKVSDKLGTPQNIRETYVRKLAGETAFLKALRKGYSLHQSEIFRVYAINTATTNFRTKHSMFNKFRSTVPYLTSGISGAKSFWQMFEMDPLGVTSRMFTGFVAPILYFMGEIMSDEEAKKKYESLAESEKDNHIFIKVGSQIIPIPVGEEIGQFSNIAVHLVETLFNENKYGFWSLMLNDLVNLIPGVDLTGFTDPDMWNAITGSPSFPDIIENGIAKALAGATPPLAQSAFMAATGRDMYTGNKINTAYVDIDDDGNPVIMTSSTSQFAKAVANVIGGDAKVIQKVVSGIGGTVLMDVLDTVTSAVQFVGSAGKEGSLTTGVERFFENASKPFAANGYDELDKRFSGSITQLWYKKDSIVHGNPNMNQYIKYNQEIAKEKDPERRQLLKNKRNDLLDGFYKEVETLVKNYRDAGGTLDKDKFSKVVSLLTFEDAARADRQFMDLNTGYNDAYNQAMQTLYDMGIENPDGVSSLGYIYTDKETGKPEIKMWNPVQMQIINDTVWAGGDIHRAQIEAIIDNGTKNSIKNLSKTEKAGEQPFWDKYNATGKLSDKEWDAIDDLREAFNAQVVIALADYMDAYGAANILSNDAVIDYLEDIIKVPSEYETVKGRNVSSGNGKLNKQQGFAESYIKKIFGVK